uniref:HDC19566 n=1 Tax=Drosophila melanogaster TaxID=7227 RepID=Q6II67_DROME|nr:TPA_inf: HDC19566 [Drosophila melanogaster]
MQGGGESSLSASRHTFHPVEYPIHPSQEFSQPAERNTCSALVQILVLVHVRVRIRFVIPAGAFGQPGCGVARTQCLLPEPSSNNQSRVPKPRPIPSASAAAIRQSQNCDSGNDNTSAARLLLNGCNLFWGRGQDSNCGMRPACWQHGNKLLLMCLPVAALPPGYQESKYPFPYPPLPSKSPASFFVYSR